MLSTGLIVVPTLDTQQGLATLQTSFRIVTAVTTVSDATFMHL